MLHTFVSRNLVLHPPLERKIPPAQKRAESSRLSVHTGLCTWAGSRRALNCSSLQNLAPCYWLWVSYCLDFNTGGIRQAGICNITFVIVASLNPNRKSDISHTVALIFKYKRLLDCACISSGKPVRWQQRETRTWHNVATRSEESTQVSNTIGTESSLQVSKDSGSWIKPCSTQD
jgi:hypothetical protein